MKNKYIIYSAFILVVSFYNAGYLFSKENDHDHKENAKEKHDNHDGHDHDDHDGHDHATHKDAKDDHVDHDGHDHATHKDDKDGKHDDHAGHDHGKEAKDDHAGHDNHAEEGLKLTDEQKKEISLTLATAGLGSIHKEISLPGEVVLNEDTLVHLVPRVTGIALKINKSIGDKVKKGDVLAVLDSAELGEAKSEYYERFNEVGCCLIELQRARTIDATTQKVFEDLKTLPSLDELRKKNYGDMGEYRAKLMVAYPEFLTKRRNYERSRKLYEKKIISENDFLEKRNEFEQARALFYSKLHDAQFKIMRHLREQERNQRVNEFKLRTAERKLKILGLTKKQIQAIQADITKIKNECMDPNCKGCKYGSKDHQQHEDHEDLFSQIEILAPAKGTIIQKHISLGEKIDDDDDDVEIYTIADLSTVWVNLKVPARDIPVIRKGTRVVIESPYGTKAEGEVALITPIIDESTRTATARIVMENPDESWKPGSFITGHIRISAKDLPVVIPRNAVQQLEGKNVVFVPKGNGFIPRAVVTGRSDRTNMEIIAGLKPGMRYVSKGAFELKSIMITSNLDSHAGHGH